MLTKFRAFGFVCFAAIILTAQPSRAESSGLVIHSAEFGVGKFHRMDNKVHPYDQENSWKPYVLPENAQADQPLVTDNTDGSVTIYFSTLDELLSSVVRVSHEKHQPVSVLNIHGHGLPGAMWFPKDAKTLDSIVCMDWRRAASGSDQANYEQYYSAVSVDEVKQIREMSKASSSGFMACVTGLHEWQGAVAKNPEFKTVLSGQAQFHFLSCVVGLGQAGEEFTKGIAELLLNPGSAGRVESSVNFGLGDWSMPEGMGFWDYLTDTQIDRDNENYVKNRTDREIAQKGTVRMVNSSGGSWVSTLLTERSFMSLNFEKTIRGLALPLDLNRPDPESATEAGPKRVRVPGTSAYVNLR